MHCSVKLVRVIDGVARVIRATCVGLLDLRAQAEVPSARRSGTPRSITPPAQRPGVQRVQSAHPLGHFAACPDPARPGRSFTLSCGREIDVAFGSPRSDIEGKHKLLCVLEGDGLGDSLWCVTTSQAGLTYGLAAPRRHGLSSGRDRPYPRTARPHFHGLGCPVRHGD